MMVGRFVVLLRGLLVVLAQTVATLAFMSFANWTDTGRWSADGWQAMAASGLLCGSVLYLAETRRYRTAPADRSRLRSAVRTVVLSFCCIACSFALGLFAMMIGTGGNWLVLGLLVVPLTTVLLFPMMVPFGVLTGLLDFLILSIGRTQTNLSAPP